MNRNPLDYVASRTATNYIISYIYLLKGGIDLAMLISMIAMLVKPS
jgi:hypothetical protein